MIILSWNKDNAVISYIQHNLVLIHPGFPQDDMLVAKVSD